MGMLFNTPGTLSLLSTLNQKFSKGNISYLAGLATTFQNLPPGNGTYAGVAAPLGILPDVSIANAQANWQKWLGHFDKHDNSKDPGKKVAKTVGKGISDALNNLGKFKQVEFFAVPDDSKDKKISATVLDFQDENGEWSKIITIYTNTFDQLDDKVHARKRHREGGTAK